MKLDNELDLESEPLLGPEDGCSQDDSSIVYDEEGSLMMALAASAPADSTIQKCPVSRLNGSWFLHIIPQGQHATKAIRGPMRIEVASPRIRVSGDIYVDDGTHGTPAKPLQPLTDAPLIIKKNWYPQLDMEEYAWYFRSLGVQYKHGVLTFKFERRLWDPLTSEFASGADTGWMKLVCGKAFNHPTLPQATIQMSGTAEIGGESYDLIARKTSPHYRGCRVEVDVMQNRSFPISAETCAGAALSFASIYRTAGWDCPAKISTSNIPDDSSLTTPELQAALTAFREPAVGPSWRLWLLVGSSQGGLFGLMFDDTEPHREGAVGFFDPTLPGDPIIEVSARNQKLGDVPAAFLRTLVHEAGHAFNLFHPKHDIHTVPIGTSIMNQTGDVMGFATEANPYPCNVTFAFDDHNRTSLIHSPDPQVAPGRKAFGWGHGDLFSGVAEPVDAGGLPRQPPQAPNLTLDLMMPDSVFRGEFVSARFVVTNTGKAPERVTTAINLSQGDLRLRVTAPGRPPADVRDRIIACGDREYQSLAPGESLEAVAQVFYTTAGRTFRQTGRYYVSAELHAGTSRFVHSKPIEVVVRAPQTPQEREISQIMMDEGVARSLALGDFGLDTSSRNKLQELVDRFGDTTTGAAAALVLANSLARPLRNIRTGKVVRKAEPEKSRQCLNIATRNRSATGVVDLAVAVVAPTDADAPVLKQVGGTGAARGKSKPKGKGKKAVGSAPASKRLAQLTRALVR